MVHLLEQRGLRHEVEVESAGTHAYHVGSRPDQRSQDAAARRGIALPSRARHFRAADFARCDYVVAMDESNLAHLTSLAGERHLERLFLLRDFDPGSPRGQNVPDPYYGEADGFETVLDLCWASCAGLLDHLQKKHKLGPKRS
jgi:protein-tyrosine phosphatase